MCRLAHVLRWRMATDIPVRDRGERSFAQQAREWGYDPASGIRLSATLQVIGKPATAGDASNGYIAPATLAGCVSQAKAKGWSYVPLLFLSSFSHADRKQGRGHDLGVPRRCGFVDLDGTGTVLARLSTTASTAYTRALFLIAAIGLRERDCRFRTVFDIGICILSVLRSWSTN